MMRAFIREHKKALVGIAVFEFLFFSVLFELPNVLFSQMKRMLSIVPPGAIAPIQSMDSLQTTYNALIKVLFGLVGSILFTFIIAVLCFAFFRSVLWHLTLHQELRWRAIRSAFFTTLLLLILSAPFFLLAAVPIIALTKQQIIPTLGQSFPLLIVLSLLVHLTSLSYLHVAKGKGAWKAFTSAFKSALDPALLLPTLALMSAYVILFLSKEALQKFLPLSVILATLLISFWSRLYIIERVPGE